MTDATSSSPLRQRRIGRSSSIGERHAEPTASRSATGDRRSVPGPADGDVVDDRFEHGEDRRAAFAWIDGKSYTCVYTLCGTAYRIISVRRANRREEQRYG